MTARLVVESLADMERLAGLLAAALEPGDVLILTGDLGAGKTTFTQFLASAMGVKGRVSSPTFVIAREHDPSGDGPGLVHVDAYRLGDADEFADLDLDSDLSEVVTVVEWGHGIAEQLSDDRLEITLTRNFELAGEPVAVSSEDLDGYDTEDQTRVVDLVPAGDSWRARVDRVSEEYLSSNRGGRNA